MPTNKIDPSSFDQDRSKNELSLADDRNINKAPTNLPTDYNYFSIRIFLLTIFVNFGFSHR